MMYDVNHEERKVSMIREKATDRAARQFFLLIRRKGKAARTYGSMLGSPFPGVHRIFCESFKRLACDVCNLLPLLRLGLIIGMPNAVTETIPAVRQKNLFLLPIISKVYNVMSPELGHYFLVLSISVALTNKLRPVAVSPHSFLFTMPFSGILFRYISSDFSNYNVFTNSNANAPSFYKISGTWSNHEGSLLLWCWIPSFYGFPFCYPARPSNISEQAKGAENKNIYFLFSSEGLDQRGRAVSLMDEQRIYKGIALFFSISLLASPNPFVRISFVCTKSLAESNPVLQDPILAIHPPCIYAGYVASAIGFCLCLSGIMNRPQQSLKNIFLFFGPFPVKPKKGRRPAEMAGRFPHTRTAPPYSCVPGSLAHGERAKSVVRKTNTMYFHFGWTRSANTVAWKQIQIWILTCWCFLTVGILLGSWWAYHELGRGGWWFWDPVENASFMPWVLATACIHSVILPKLNDWTLFLNMVTFLCCISGTFSVRSGLPAPVHSFATDSTRGISLWCFFFIITSISFISFFRMKQQSSTQGALSVPSSNRDPTVSKPVNQILRHSRSTLFAHLYRSDRLAKLMEGTEGHDRVYEASRKPK